MSNDVHGPALPTARRNWMGSGRRAACLSLPRQPHVAHRFAHVPSRHDCAAMRFRIGAGPGGSRTRNLYESGHRAVTVPSSASVVAREKRTGVPVRDRGALRALHRPRDRCPAAMGARRLRRRNARRAAPDRTAEERLSAREDSPDAHDCGRKGDRAHAVRRRSHASVAAVRSAIHGARIFPALPSCGRVSRGNRAVAESGCACTRHGHTGVPHQRADVAAFGTRLRAHTLADAPASGPACRVCAAQSPDDARRLAAGLGATRRSSRATSSSISRYLQMCERWATTCASGSAPRVRCG